MPAAVLVESTDKIVASDDILNEAGPVNDLVLQPPSGQFTQYLHLKLS
jgi:hypothetical protein